MTDASDIWQRGQDVLTSAINPSNGTITVNLGSVISGETESVNAEWWQPNGFASRPAKPTPNEHAAQTVVLKGSDVDCCVASRDIRCQAIYGALDHGETCIFSTAGQGRAIFKKDGGVHLYTRAGNAANGAGIVIQADAMGDAIRAINSLGYGLIIDPTGIRLTVGKAGIFLDAATGSRMIFLARSSACLRV